MKVDFDPNSDAEVLKNAMKSKDEDKIIKIICKRTYDERQKIKEVYNKKYNSDIIKDLKDTFHGDFEDAVTGLFYTSIDYDCVQLKKAVQGLGTDENTLIEILCTRPYDVIEKIKKRYSELYPGSTLLNDIEDDTSGNFRNLLVALLSTKRNKNKNEIDKNECEKCAKMLYEAGEKKIGTDEEVFIKIFTEKSRNEFLCIAQLYFDLTKHTLLQAIEKEFYSDTKNCLIGILYAILSPSEFFAKCINRAIKGLGTDDTSLIRILITRKETDMHLIKDFYKKLFKQDMIKDIEDDTSGNYRKILIELAS